MCGQLKYPNVSPACSRRHPHALTPTLFCLQAARRVYENALASLAPSASTALSSPSVHALALSLAQMEAAQPKRDAGARALHVLTWMAATSPFRPYEALLAGTSVQAGRWGPIRAVLVDLA